MKRKNPEAEEFRQNLLDSPVEIELDRDEEITDLESMPLWYQQIVQMDEDKRLERVKKAMALIKENKPETFEFIKKFKCELVGFIPRIEYSMAEGAWSDLEVTWRHPFGIDTLLLWCPAGEFVFAVNANLMYNETKLNKIKGNNIPPLRGLTG
jgi:hypothetical protein